MSVTFAFTSPFILQLGGKRGWTLSHPASPWLRLSEAVTTIAVGTTDGIILVPFWENGADPPGIQPPAPPNARIPCNTAAVWSDEKAPTKMSRLLLPEGGVDFGTLLPHNLVSIQTPASTNTMHSEKESIASMSTLKRRPKVSAWVVGVCLSLLWVVSQLPRDQHQQLDPQPAVTLNSTGEPWNPFAKIKPSTQLEWHPCDESLEDLKELRCARLTVPLDYHQQSGPILTRNAGEVQIALMLLPAKNETAAVESAKSPLLINPGGPGGSGTLFQLAAGRALQTLFGDDQPILGFDPRGIVFTTPKADCWTPPPECKGCLPDYLTGLSHRQGWATQVQDAGLVNSSNVALKFLDASFRSANDLCRVKHESLGGASILSHSSTAHVAQDMLSIVDAWDKWLDREAASRGIKPTPNPTRGKLVYWGFSYGSYLGSVFASMFPDRVGRVLLDGVVDAEEYSSDVWANSLRDADHIWGRFFDYCAEAGPTCNLYRNGDNPASIRQRYEAILLRLDEHPVTFIHPQYFYPHLVRSEYVRRVIFGVLYFPVQGFPALAMILNWLHEGNYALFAQLVSDQLPMCALPVTFDLLATDATRAVMCADKKRPVNLPLPELRAKYEKMAGISQFADVWSEVMLQCNGWNISKPHVRAPPFLLSDPNASPVTTSFPILFLSNTYDPVTPLTAAVKMALRFRDAGLVEQKTEGHSTLSSVSRCIARTVRDYVVHGKVPPAPKVDGDNYLKGTWATCEADEKPWKMIGSKGGLQIAEEDREIVGALKILREAMVAMPRWGVKDTNMKSVQSIPKKGSRIP